MSVSARGCVRMSAGVRGGWRCGSLELELGDCELSDVGAGTKLRSC